MAASSTCGQPALATQPQLGPRAPSVKQTTFGVRRSCDACGRRKRKCDGERPCGRCVRHGGECKYSKRRWHLPQPEQGQQQQQHPDGDGAYPRQLKESSTPGAPLACGVLPFKRCRLSASPATGLVGMQENGLLSDFFICVGFLPLTTQSHIRETMFKMMITPDVRQRGAVEEGGGERWQVKDIETGGLHNVSRGKTLPMGPSICVFWCAIALGALARGSPPHKVAGYSQLAMEALSSSYSGPHAEVAKAWAILAYLHGFMGDLATFQKYLVRANSSFVSSIEQGSSVILPVGFAELVKSGEVGYFSEMELKSTRRLSPQQLNGAASEAELYQYVMQSFQDFEHTVASKVVHSTAGDPSDSQVLAGAMVSAWAKIDFEPLEEVVDRSSVGAGVGGVIINSALVFAAARTGDVHNTLKRIERCVDVFEQYPGVCRSVIGNHGAHTMFSVLAVLDVSGARDMYDRLRASYNSCRSPDSLPAPPFEEWQGVSSVCDGLPCRATEKLIASEHLTALSIPSAGFRTEESGGDQHGRVVGPGGQMEGGVVSAKIFGDDDISRSTPFLSENGGVRLEPSVSSTCETFRGPSHVGHAGGAGWCLESPGASMASTTSATNPPTLNFVQSEKKHIGRKDASRQLDATHSDGGGVSGSPETSAILLHSLGDEIDNEQGASNAAHGRNHATCGVGDGVIECAETTLTMRQVLGEVLVEEADDLDVGAADWLDATHALLDAVHEPGQEGIW